ncbi:hypothetical protein [Oceanobacillus sp. 1P07AA]|uniref:hypothetical protein n=1 Tax=Oceanobacillus sp. 1P07AA TaxID=3132293 RepID=UPI0039A53F2F
MEVILIFVIGFIVLLLAIIAIIKSITHRIQNSGKEVKDKIEHLEKRLDELENSEENKK